MRDKAVAFYATNQDLTFPGSVPGRDLIATLASFFIGVVVPGAGWTSIASYSPILFNFNFSRSVPLPAENR